MRAETSQRDVKRPSILDDVQQAPNEELNMFISMPHRELFASTSRGDDPSEVRQLLMATIEDQHDLLHAQIEKNRRVIMEHISCLTWPCQQPSSYSMDGRAPPDTCCTGKAHVQRNLPEGSNSQPMSESPALACQRTLESISDNVGSAIADQTRLRTGSNKGRGSLRTKSQELLKRVGCGQFNSSFDSAVCMIILMNIIVIIVQLQWQGYKASIVLGLSEDDKWDGAMLWFDALEHVFTILFLLELLARMWVQKRKYFSDVANLFDAFLVLSSIVELYILTPLGMASGTNLTMLRVVRLCKIVRVLRVVRIMKLFLSMHIIVAAIIHSMSSLFWSVLVLFIIILTGGLFMSQNLAEYIMDDANPLDMRNWVYTYYGGSARATLTMFEVTMSGCWPNYSRRLVEEVSIWYVVFFVVYVAIVVFAVTRIISALLLRDTLQAADSECDRVIIELKHHRRAVMDELEQFFMEVDQSEDGLVDRDEFEAMLKRPNVSMWLNSIGLAVNEYVALFNLLDSGSGTISFQEFMDGVQRLKGNARSVDILSISLELGRLKQNVLQLEQGLHKLSLKAHAPVVNRDELDTSDVRRGIV